MHLRGVGIFRNIYIKRYSMNFEQFILVMMEQVKSRLSEDTLVERQEILKNNGVRLVGISIRREGEMAAPIIYMEAYYSQYCDGVPVEVLAEHMLMILQMTPAIPDYDFEEFFDFHKIKHRIVYKLINAKNNAKLLKKVPNLPMLDFEKAKQCRGLFPRNRGQAPNNSPIFPRSPSRWRCICKGCPCPGLPKCICHGRILQTQIRGLSL